MNSIDRQYKELLEQIIRFGVDKKDRTGTGTKSIFGWQIRHNMKEGFPLLTTKKMAWKSIVVELLWFLKGDTNIKYLVDNGCHIWDGDAYKNYTKTPVNYITFSERSRHFKVNGLEFNSGYPNYAHYSKEEFINKIKTDDEFAKKWGELGPIYGKQWRGWKGVGDYRLPDNVSDWVYTESGLPVTEYKPKQIDQIQNLINELKTNPDSRRLMVNAWNVGELDQMVLPPCHYGFQVYTRELSLNERMDYWFKNNKPNRDVCDSVDESTEVEQHKYFDGAGVPKRAISLMFNMRSTDVGLGLGFNLASYGLLLIVIAKQVNMVPNELVYNGGDVHLYLNHVEPIKEQLTREPYQLPTIKISNRVVNDISEYTLDDFTLENYQYHPTIRMPLSN